MTHRGLIHEGHKVFECIVTTCSVEIELPVYRYQHAPNSSPCACDFPRVWVAYPLECMLCGRLLPDSNTSSPS